MISRSYAGLPPRARGQRIGLFGGSFNPPHDGHRAASILALRRLQLDWIWWMVTPGNPFKDVHELPPMAERIEAARRVAAHPKIVVTGVEQTLGSRFTYDILAALRRRCANQHLVLIMGADAFTELHRWKYWRRITRLVPLAVVDRPGFTMRATQSHSATTLRGARLGEAAAARLAVTRPPAYVFLHGPRTSLSSTKLRSGDA